MLDKLYFRYNSETVAFRIAKLSKLLSKRFISVRAYMFINIETMEARIKQLQITGNTTNVSLAVGILVASPDVPKLGSVAVSIRTLWDDFQPWEDVSNQRIEKVKYLLCQKLNVGCVKGHHMSLRIINFAHWVMNVDHIVETKNLPLYQAAGAQQSRKDKSCSGGCHGKSSQERPTMACYTHVYDRAAEKWC